jgi:hypothetical protein
VSKGKISKKIVCPKSNLKMMFCHVVVVEEEVTKMLTWWKENAMKFPNVAFFAQCVFNIPKS